MYCFDTMKKCYFPTLWDLLMDLIIHLIFEDLQQPTKLRYRFALSINQHILDKGLSFPPSLTSCLDINSQFMKGCGKKSDFKKFCELSFYCNYWSFLISCKDDTFKFSC